MSHAPPRPFASIFAALQRDGFCEERIASSIARLQQGKKAFGDKEVRLLCEEAKQQPRQVVATQEPTLPEPACAARPAEKVLPPVQPTTDVARKAQRMSAEKQAGRAEWERTHVEKIRLCTAGEAKFHPSLNMGYDKVSNCYE